MKVIYQSPNYSLDEVTGKYVRVSGKKGKYLFTVFETETCWTKGTNYGKPGMGYTIKEYITDGSELPIELRDKCIKSKTTEKWL